MTTRRTHRLPLLPTLLILAVLIAAAWLRARHFGAWPPGLSFDESINGIDAWRLARTGRIALYIAHGEPEPAYRFLMAILVGLLGPTTFSMRLISLYVGVMGVAAAYRAGRHMTPVPGWRRLAGLVAAGVLAILIGHIHMSRVAYRGILLPFGLLMFVDAFVSAWRRPSRAIFLTAGAWLGFCAAMTYTSGLAVIPVAALGLLIEFARILLSPSLKSRREVWGEVRGWVAGVLWIALGALIITSPVIVLVMINPNLYGRIGQVSREPLGPATLIERWPLIVRSFETLYQTGDINPQYNIASAPLLFWRPLFWLLIAGIAACLLRWRRLAGWLALGLLAAMLLPAALAFEARHGLRLVGEYGALPLVLAAAVDLPAWLSTRLATPSSPDPFPHGGGKGNTAPSLKSERGAGRVRLAAAALFATLLLIGGVRGWQIIDAHFRSDLRWGEGGVISAWSWFFETRRVAIAEAIADEGDEVIYVPLSEVAHPVFRYLTARSHPRTATFATYFNAAPGEPLTLPAGQVILPMWVQEATTFAAFMPDGTVVLLPRFDAATLDALRLHRVVTSRVLVDAYGEPAAAVPDYPVDGAEFAIQTPVAHAAAINYADQFRVVGWDAPAELPAEGGTVQVTVYLAPGESPQRDAYIAAQLWTAGLENIASSQRTLLLHWAYPPPEWQPGDIVPFVLDITVPEELAPGGYYLAVGLPDYRFRNLPVLGPDGVPVAEMAIAGMVKVPRAEAVSTDDMLPTEARFSDEIELIGYQIADESGAPLDAPHPGQTAVVTLYWRAVRVPDGDYTAFLHVADPAGNIAAQSDLKPEGGTYPTLIWSEGEIVATTHLVSVPSGSEGPYTLYAGWYAFPSLERLPVTQGGADVPDRRAVVGE